MSGIDVADRRLIRYLLATVVCAAILAAGYFAAPALRSHGVPTGGLMMLVVAAILAWAWLALTRSKQRGR